MAGSQPITLTALLLANQIYKFTCLEDFDVISAFSHTTLTSNGGLTTLSKQIDHSVHIGRYIQLASRLQTAIQKDV